MATEHGLSRDDRARLADEIADDTLGHGPIEQRIKAVMDVVRRQVQKMRGRVDIESRLGSGTTFVIKLPLTLAIIDGLVVGVGEQRFIVPIFVIVETFRSSARPLSSSFNVVTEMPAARANCLWDNPCISRSRMRRRGRIVFNIGPPKTNNVRRSGSTSNVS